jgi:hypothetical protein
MTEKRNEGKASAKTSPSSINEVYKHNNTEKAKPSTTKTTKGGRGRLRNFATVVYPESAPENWLEVLDRLHVPAFVSPLHNQDINPDGSPKKPHWHVLIMFAGVKTKEQAQAVIDAIGGVGCESVSTVRGYARYLVHADNPEKAQYSKSDVRAFSGADYDAITHLPTDDVKMVREMMEYIRVNQITSFAQFADVCAVDHEEWFRALVTKSTYFIKEYIKSLVWETSQPQPVQEEPAEDVEEQQNSQG